MFDLLRRLLSRPLSVMAYACLGFLFVLSLVTWLSLREIPVSFDMIYRATTKPQVLDRYQQPLTITYQNRWNVHNVVALHDIPLFLQQAVILAEDKRFYRHQGVDWWARLHALWQNIISLRAVRGASTISEQAIRLLHPRSRTLWSRWLEGFEAYRLERQFSKADILEFYLNQIPYAGNRRGVAQAGRYYFNRDLDTLNEKEMMALAVLIRAPSRLDLYNDTKEQIEKPIQRLAKAAYVIGLVDKQQLQQLQAERLVLEKPSLPLQAEHFVKQVYQSNIEIGDIRNELHTTLDSQLQGFVQAVLNRRVEQMHQRQVYNGAALVVDHKTSEVLAWVVADSGKHDSLHGNHGTKIDAVQSLRQPGSTLKPFVYASALEKGWMASTIIEDEPLSELVGHGLHAYRNYSRSFYGKVSLREALGNSLNIPAVKAVQYVGVNHFLSKLHQLGIKSLTQHPDYYGDGLALGNGEISLFELVNAYSVLAQGGVYRPLRVLKNPVLSEQDRVVFSPEVSSLIGHILSDPAARQLEFGASNLLQLPVQTAIKTGTSSDYRDAWTVGYNHRYTVGVWMGNMDNTPMQEVTGSVGPAIVLRAIFSELNKRVEDRPLYFSRKLIAQAVCIETGLLATKNCTRRSEWFLPNQTLSKQHEANVKSIIRIQQPANGLLLAMDPRIPDDKEAFELKLNSVESLKKVNWYMDGRLLSTSLSSNYIWPLQRGRHDLYAEVWLNQQTVPVLTNTVSFLVK